MMQHLKIVDGENRNSPSSRISALLGHGLKRPGLKRQSGPGEGRMLEHVEERKCAVYGIKSLLLVERGLKTPQSHQYQLLSACFLYIS